jgi:hypothetical protein
MRQRFLQQTPVAPQPLQTGHLGLADFSHSPCRFGGASFRLCDVVW